MRAQFVLVVLLLAGCTCAASHGAPVEDAAIDVEAPRDTSGSVCSAPGIGTAVSGMTPLGIRSFDYAFLGQTFWSGKDCYDLRLGFGAEREVEVESGFEPWEGLEVWAPARADARSGSTVEVHVLLREGDMELSTNGVVTLDTLETDTAVATGTLEVTADGWSLTGTFVTAHCWVLDDFCI